MQSLCWFAADGNVGVINLKGFFFVVPLPTYTYNFILNINMIWHFWYFGLRDMCRLVFSLCFRFEVLYFSVFIDFDIGSGGNLGGCDEVILWYIRKKDNLSPVLEIVSGICPIFHMPT